MIKYLKSFTLKPMAYNPPDDWENGEWLNVRKVWSHVIEKNEFVFSEYCFTEHPYPGFYARANKAFKDSLTSI